MCQGFKETWVLGFDFILGSFVVIGQALVGHLANVIKSIQENVRNVDCFFYTLPIRQLWSA